jgi:hypothetical protein
MDDAWGYHGDDARPPSEAFLDKTRIQLSRSHDAKLYIDIDFRYLDNMSDVRNIMKELQPHLHRAFFFRTLLPDWDWMVAVRDHSVRLGLSLEELHIHIDTADAEEQLPVTFLSVPCPRLNKVVLEHTPLTCIRPHSNVSSPPESPSSSTLTLPPPDIPLPTTLLPSLQHLHLIRDTRQGSSMRFSIPFSLLLTTLSTTPTLRTLHIQSAFFLLTGCEHIFQRQPTKLIMPQLVELTFNFVDTTNIGLFLENVDCQSLKTLKIRMDGSAGSTEDSVGFLARVCGPSPGTWAALDTIPHQPSYSRNPFSSLRHLDLRGISTTGPAIYSFIRALHSLPQLTALALSSPPSGCFGSRIWKLLGEPCVSAPSLAWEGSSSERDRQTWILPALQALVIQNARDVYGHDILRLVRARKAASAGSRGAGRGMQTIVDADDMQQTEGGDGAVAEVTYLKISGCYTLNRDGEIVNELKMFVRTVVF